MEENRMNKKIIELDKGQVEGFRIDLDNAPLILVKAKRGYVMCGYLNINAANKLGDIAGRVTGVKSFEDVLNAEIVEISDNAKKIGLTVGMKGKDFLNKLM
jgi:uncharacterized protein YunC (DUF1805 family)